MGANPSCRPNNLTVFQSALLLLPLRLPQLTEEQATQQTPIVSPPSRFPRGTFDRRECLAHSANSQQVHLQIDRSLVKEPRGEAINILCLIACSMLNVTLITTACTDEVCLGHVPLPD